MTVRIDGTRMRLAPRDLDGNGIAGGVEGIQQQGGIMSIKDTSELGEALEHQNKDVLDPSGFSTSDYNARINSFQFSPLVAVDMIATMKVISARSRDVVRHIMRKSVSVDGKGREEFVNVVTGKKENDLKKMGANGVIGAPQK